MDRLDPSDMAVSTAGPAPARDPLAERRLAWAARRAAAERRVGRGARGRIALARRAQRWLGPLLGLTGLRGPGRRNALDIRLESHIVTVPDLPPAFEGYRILHASDLHVDVLAGATEAARRLVAGLGVDLCVLTGDYVHYPGADSHRVTGIVAGLVGEVDSRDGVLAVLGNHDSVGFVAPFEAAGIRVLANETVTIARRGGRLRVTGLDDVHRYWTAEARQALADSGKGPKIALVHSPEMVEAAAAAGYDLYLSGHTHGGQVCLPGGRPLMTNLRSGRRYVAGMWRCGGMMGYTNRGVGVSPPAVRFNCRGEVALLTLSRW